MEELKEVEEVLENTNEVTLSDEDMDLLRKNIRPEWMPYDIYKEIRRKGTEILRSRRKGNFIHVSSQIQEEDVDKIIYTTDEETGKRVQRLTKVKQSIRRTAKPYHKPK